jgi:hypothetical protein
MTVAAMREYIVRWSDRHGDHRRIVSAENATEARWIIRRANPSASLVSAVLA